MAGRLEPAEATRVCAEAARLLNQALTRVSDGYVRPQLAVCLLDVAARMETAEAVRVGAEPARLLSREFGHKTNNLMFRQMLGRSLQATVRRLKPTVAARWLKDALVQEKEDAIHYGYAKALAELVRQLEPAVAARWLGEALAQEKESWARGALALGLAETAGRLDSAAAARLCAEPARLLNQALAQEKDAGACAALAQGLAAVAGFLEPAAAIRVCAEAARLLNEALARAQGSEGANSLQKGLAAVAWQLEPAEAIRVCVQAGPLLATALSTEKNDWGSYQLDQGLATVAARLEPAKAARLLNRALVQEKDPNQRKELAYHLAAVADWLNPDDASHACAEAARLLYQTLAQEKDGGHARPQLPWGLEAVVGRLDSEEATQIARAVTLRIVADPDLHLPEALELLLSNGPRHQVRPRAFAIGAAIGMAAHGPVWSLPLLPEAAEPLPCRLSTQELVELLKMPTCIGAMRRVVLNQLGNHYGRTFANHWEFVRFAKEQQLNLDLTSPPKRWRGRL